MQIAPAVCAMPSMMSTPGMIGFSGKCPAKYGSLAVTFLMPIAKLSPSMSMIRSTIRNGSRCGSSSVDAVNVEDGYRRVASSAIGSILLSGVADMARVRASADRRPCSCRCHASTGIAGITAPCLTGRNVAADGRSRPRSSRRCRSSRCPALRRHRPIMTKSPIVTLPEIPAFPAIRQCLPITTLCAI